MSFKHETKDQPAGNETTKQKNIFLRERLSPRHRFLEHSSLESIILFPFHPTFRNEINLQICKSYPPYIMRIGYFQIVKYLTTND